MSCSNLSDGLRRVEKPESMSALNFTKEGHKTVSPLNLKRSHDDFWVFMPFYELHRLFEHVKAVYIWCYWAKKFHKNLSE